MVYFSPVPWDSFAQRPHKFVMWFHARTRGDVLWVDPYPTRFPNLADLRGRSSGFARDAHCPNWLRVLQPRALPIEPLHGSALVNGLLWKPVLLEVLQIDRGQDLVVVVGKPSLLALAALKGTLGCHSVYDAMDDFPAFYAGFSERAMRRLERRVAGMVEHVWTTSAELQRKWLRYRSDVTLVANGLDPGVLPSPQKRVPEEPRVFGYVGTIASWFDWELIESLGRARPHDIVRLIGPIHASPPARLPNNVELLPPCPHADALKAMSKFDVGLIPFKRNALTASVDPVKYYEYRALGLPVLSTDFGEMAERGGTPCVYLVRERSALATAAEQAMGCGVLVSPDFARRHSWESRFDSTGLLDSG